MRIRAASSATGPPTSVVGPPKPGARNDSGSSNDSTSMSLKTTASTGVRGGSNLTGTPSSRHIASRQSAAVKGISACIGGGRVVPVVGETAAPAAPVEDVAPDGFAPSSLPRDRSFSPSLSFVLRGENSWPTNRTSTSFDDKTLPLLSPRPRGLLFFSFLSLLRGVRGRDASRLLLLFAVLSQLSFLRCFVGRMKLGLRGLKPLLL
mmetsp:Transcript_20389/g.51504  ORF Transcript_20389/g.51504 Transcript_20389/m.51504 type:complete len:206 (-) Transcript_20389:2319-2936(-)